MRVLDASPGFTIDPQRWPDLADVPQTRLRAAIVAAALARIARSVHIGIQLPGGRRVGSQDDAAPLVRLNRPQAVYRRFAARGPVGLGEAYQAGDWDSPDLTGLLTAVAGRMDPPAWANWLRRRVGPKRPPSERNSIVNAPHHIHHHYDLSNELFALFLDETMTYSSALFPVDQQGRPIAAEAAFAEAQRRKIKRVLDLAWVGADTRLLEIGTGWGELAIAAASRGALVHTITLSRQQCEFAKRRVLEAGYADRVKVELCDYRKLKAVDPGRYNAIVSVEMIEAVGEDYWPIFFGTLEQQLAPGGTVVLQAIATGHDRLLANRQLYTWIQKYVFPGGMLPSIQAIKDVCQRYTTLKVRDMAAFGEHYAETLRLWRERFAAQSTRLSALGFDETFRRTWDLYLAYCEAGFRAGHINVHHLVLERPV